MTETSPTPAETNIFLGYIDEDEYCRQRGISVRTAQRDRQLRQSPPYTVVGQRVMYRIDSIRTWLLERERQVERKASAPRAGGRK
ncbi:conserved hypothetical protein [Candidatus Terasakiella magnetica]|jgi:hypothetical protein|uniref:hypothetical protein n=1 Tax=Magnetospirillum sp. LM-5 TaxID=2681466 RepID=UPI001383D9DD|nr:hypothetical protein [Magnetospirillum sp. LM-5]MBF0094479.1 hypothetical protein [Alphaproteobacteria bacterium]CAA7622143.1 conserved hypothetical protein [Magnetospirillum sp. LM-5]CAA7627593.1 conserved hypothetical protein [Candidatus Terasakiella magnetica]